MLWFTGWSVPVPLPDVYSDLALQTAIAASVDLRCYGLSTPRHDGKLSVTFADIDHFTHEWDIASLPWDAVTPVPLGAEHPAALDQTLLDAIGAVALPPELDIAPNARVASLAFLYLYMASAPPGGTRPALSFAARSALPIGAGLGSSAAFSVCAATALLLAHGRLALPSVPRTGDAHGGRRALAPALADEANRWAFASEQVLHGTPSGVDNSVAVLGGALAYTKGVAGARNALEPIAGFRSLRFVLTDSRVPRDTKALVAGVAAKKLAVSVPPPHTAAGAHEPRRSRSS
jgi:mevalonate kinase